MPKKDGKLYCLNHPEREMVVLNEDNPDTFHTLRLATWIYGNRLKMENKSTGFDIYACAECGYSELYLTSSELKLLGNKPPREEPTPREDRRGADKPDRDDAPRRRSISSFFTSGREGRT